MKRLFLCLSVGAAFIAAGCRPARQEVRSDYRRADSLRALVAEDLRVTMRDVVITPADTAAPRIAAARVELTRQTASRVERNSLETAAQEEKTVPPRNVRPLWRRLLPLALILLTVAVIWRRRQ